MIVPLVLLLASAAAPRAVVVTTVTGFTAAEAKLVNHRTLEDVALTGITPVRPAGEVAVDCVGKPACAAGVVTVAKATWLVSFEVLRAGSRLAVTARLLDKSGAAVTDDSLMLPADMVLGGSLGLLPEGIGDRLKASATAFKAMASADPEPTELEPTEPTTTTPATPTTTTPAATTTTNPSTPTTPGEASLTTGAIVGVGVAALGSLLLVGGGAAALGQNAVRLDPGAAGEARAATAVTIPLGASVAAVGLVGLAVGAGLLATAGPDDSAAPPEAVVTP